MKTGNPIDRSFNIKTINIQTNCYLLYVLINSGTNQHHTDSFFNHSHYRLAYDSCSFFWITSYCWCFSFGWRRPSSGISFWSAYRVDHHSLHCLPPHYPCPIHPAQTLLTPSRTHRRCRQSARSVGFRRHPTETC